MKIRKDKVHSWLLAAVMALFIAFAMVYAHRVQERNYAAWDALARAENAWMAQARTSVLSALPQKVSTVLSQETSTVPVSRESHDDWWYRTGVEVGVTYAVLGNYRERCTNINQAIELVWADIAANKKRKREHDERVRQSQEE